MTVSNSRYAVSSCSGITCFAVRTHFCTAACRSSAQTSFLLQVPVTLLPKEEEELSWSSCCTEFVQTKILHLVILQWARICLYPYQWADHPSRRL